MAQHVLHPFCEGSGQVCLTLLVSIAVQHTQEALIMNKYMLFAKRALSNDIIGDLLVKGAFIV